MIYTSHSTTCQRMLKESHEPLQEIWTTMRWSMQPKSVFLDAYIRKFYHAKETKDTGYN